MFNSLRFRIRLFVVLMILGSTVTIIVFVSRNVENVLTRQLKKEAGNLIESVTQHVEIEYNSILFHKEAALNDRKQGLKDIIDLALAVIHSFYDLYETGVLPEAEARKQAMETLRAMRYGDDVGYIWLNNLDKTMPTLEMHPVLPELEGRELTDERYYSAHGMTEHLLKAFVEVCERDGAGFVDYLWPKPLHNGVTEDRPKISYVKLFRPWGWVVGTGVYIDDIEAAAAERMAAVKQELGAIIGSMDLGPNGYMYIFDGSSEVIMHPNLTGQYLKDMTNSATGNDFFTDLAGSVTKSGGILTYNWNKPTQDLDDMSYEKHCYTDYFEPLDWYISASYYNDEIMQPIDGIKQKIVIIASGFIIIALLISFLLSRSLAAPLQRLAATAAIIEKKGIENVHVPVCGTNETRELGRVLAAMLTSIREREQQLKGIAQTLPGTICQLTRRDDNQFEFRYMSEKAASIFDIPKDRMLSFDHFYSMIDENDKAAFLATLSKSIEQGEPWFFEGRIHKHAGQILWIQGRGTPVNQKGDVVLNGMLLDITEQKQTEIQLFQSRKMDSIGQLAGGIAHDFNNMLGVILGYGELLQEGMDPESESAEFVNAIISAADNATDLTGKLLAFSRQAKNISTPIDLHEIISSSTQLLGRSIDKRIVIQQELEAESSVIVGDPSQLQNVLLNLGLNARDAMKDGGTLTISTSNTELDRAFCSDSRFDVEPGSYILVRVEDSGCGISKEIQEKIFDPFFTTKEVGKGTGLGLAAVYGTVKAHGGAIHLYSEEGQGAIFHLYFPVAPDQAPPPPGKSGEAGVEFHGSGCVLIIDDEGIFRAMAERLFQNLGYAVITAVDGQDGVEKYKLNQAKINLVVLDMIMPRMDGKDCYYAIRKLNPTAKVLLSSGFTGSRSVSALMDDGVVGFIKKPYRRAEVCEILRTL